MKKRYYFLITFVALLIWLLTGGNYTDSENNPIKKITKTTGLYLLGKRKIWTFDKHIEYYNSKGQLTRNDWYNGEDSIHWSYIYAYYPFDSLYKISWLTGSDLSVQKITEYKYDSLHRLIKKTESSVNKRTNDTTVYEIDRYYYDSLGRNHHSIMKHFSTPDTTTSFFLKNYNTSGKVIQKIHQTRTNQQNREKYITTYTYDERGFIKYEFGGLSNDSLYYKTNDKGQVIEKKEQYGDFVRTCDKYWYDEYGNEVKTFLDIDSGHTYDFIYDKNNRLLIEYRPWSFFGLLRAGVKYDDEYYVELMPCT